jgi:hypothetical protein
MLALNRLLDEARQLKENGKALRSTHGAIRPEETNADCLPVSSIAE